MSFKSRILFQISIIMLNFIVITLLGCRCRFITVTQIAAIWSNCFWSWCSVPSYNELNIQHVELLELLQVAPVAQYQVQLTSFKYLVNIQYVPKKNWQLLDWNQPTTVSFFWDILYSIEKGLKHFAKYFILKLWLFQINAKNDVL